MQKISKQPYCFASHCDKGDITKAVTGDNHVATRTNIGAAVPVTPEQCNYSQNKKTKISGDIPFQMPTWIW